MDLFLTIWSLGGIAVCVFAMHVGMNIYREKGIAFSRRSIVVRCYAYAAVPVGGAVAAIVYLCRTYDFDYSPRPDISLADYALFLLFIWAACAMVFLCLLLSRAHDRETGAQDS